MDHPYLARFWTYFTQVFVPLQPRALVQAEPSASGASSSSTSRARSGWRPRSLVLTILIAIPLGIYPGVPAQHGLRLLGDRRRRSCSTRCRRSSCACSCWTRSASTGRTCPSSPPAGVAPWAMFTDPVGLLPARGLPDHALGRRAQPVHARHRPRGPGPGLRAHRQGQGLQRVGAPSSATPSATPSGPIIVILGLSIPALLGGALIIESVFNYGGLGIQTVTAAHEPRRAHGPGHHAAGRRS